MPGFFIGTLVKVRNLDKGAKGRIDKTSEVVLQPELEAIDIAQSCIIVERMIHQLTVDHAHNKLRLARGINQSTLGCCRDCQWLQAYEMLRLTRVLVDQVAHVQDVEAYFKILPLLKHIRKNRLHDAEVGTRNHRQECTPAFGILTAA